MTAGLTGTVSKTYDGTTSATLATSNYGLTGVFGSDNVTVSAGSASYASANAGTGIGVAASGLVLGGAQAGDYVLASTAASANIGVITPATLTVGLTGTVSKTYDGTTAAALAASNYDLNGVIGSDSVTVSTGPASYASKNVGTGLEVTAAGLGLSGVQAGDYALASTTASGTIGTITPATLTYTANAVTRSYGSANPSFTGTVTGFVGADTQSTATTGTLAFTSPATVASPVGSYAINGTGLTANNGNYVLTQAAGNATALTIAQAALQVSYSVTNASSTYGTLATLGSATLTGVMNGDQVSGVVGAFSGGSEVTLTARTAAGSYGEQVVSLVGSGAGNYAIASVGNTPGTLTINPLAITVTGVTATNKVYNGTTTDPLATGSATLVGVLPGDTVTLNGTSATGTFASKTVGTGTAVTASGLGLSGSSAGNYVLTQPTGLTATITPATVTVTLTGTVSKPGDGTSTAALTPSNYTLTGVVSGDSVTLNGPASGTYGSSGVGNGIAVTVTGLTLTGPQAGNYSLASTSVTADIGTITPAPAPVVPPMVPFITVIPFQPPPDGADALVQVGADNGFGPLPAIITQDPAGMNIGPGGIVITTGQPLAVGPQQVLTATGGHTLVITLPPPKVSLLEGQQ